MRAGLNKLSDTYQIAEAWLDSLNAVWNKQVEWHNQFYPVDDGSLGITDPEMIDELLSSEESEANSMWLVEILKRK